MSIGKVYLVGAGPGDPGLLTCRALELIKTADVIAYDALISPSILALANPKSELISVGYRGYGSKGLGYQMHPQIIEKALQSKTVVRLKSGDPLIFGRASQECEELNKNNIPFEIVPGITSATGASAYAGFPLTHRNYASDVIITSGHDLRGGSPSQSNWEALGKSTGTIVIYMAASKIKENCHRLIEMGRPKNTPAAIIANGTRSTQNVITGTLGDLHESVKFIDKSTPAIIVAGEVVRLREQFLWFEKKPLHNFTILLIRSRTGPSLIAELLKKQGADVIEAPWITVSRLRKIKLLNPLSYYQRIIFSCKDGVSFFLNELTKNKIDSRELKSIEVVAVGEKVADELLRFAILPDLILQGQCHEALESHYEKLKSGRALVIGSSRGRINFQKLLIHFDVQFDYLPVFKYQYRFPKFETPLVDFVILPSSTSAKLFFKSHWANKLQETPLIIPGPITEATVIRLGGKKIHRTLSDHPEEIVSLVLSLRRKKHEFH